jgi:hypothetical protein
MLLVFIAVVLVRVTVVFDPPRLELVCQVSRGVFGKPSIR